MKYSEAQTLAQKVEVPPGYMRIDLTYNTFLVLPHAEATIFMSLLNKAEYLEERYGAPPVIRPVGKDDLKFSLMSAAERQMAHMAQLLNVPVSDLDDLKRAEDPPPF